MFRTSGAQSRNKIDDGRLRKRMKTLKGKGWANLNDDEKKFVTDHRTLATSLGISVPVNA
ncbi:MAG TPA: hypothetical protein VG984_00210 [Candidatus Paceibacterota bacterium]|nr:hypothetical protein [Candidatus Paceibacterota bacterium]